jgi:hypothetical protein
MVSKEKYDELYEDWIEAKAAIAELQNETAVLNSGQRLPTLCPAGGEHQWYSKCQKCGMGILYNPEAEQTKAPKAPAVIERSLIKDG